MRPLVILGIFFLAATLGAGDTSKLVEAGKENKAKRKASKSKVITNKDVKNSKGKLTELADKPLPPVDKKADTTETIEQQDARYRARLEAEERVDAAAKKVADLEKKLEDLERRYYEENDPIHRDEVILKKFVDTTAELEKARLELTEAAPKP